MTLGAMLMGKIPAGVLAVVTCLAAIPASAAQFMDVSYGFCGTNYELKMRWTETKRPGGGTLSDVTRIFLENKRTGKQFELREVFQNENATIYQSVQLADGNVMTIVTVPYGHENLYYISPDFSGENLPLEKGLCIDPSTVQSK